MTDLEIMQRAKMYMDKLANGINPLDDTTLSENDIVNNVRISRCLFYVSDVLRQVMEKERGLKENRIPKEDFYISFEDIQNFRFSDTPITISEITRRINSLNQNENMKRLTRKPIIDWLISLEMLQIEISPDGRRLKRPTEYGKDLGISTERIHSMSGSYTAVFYNLSAQHFIIDNIEAVIAMMHK